MPTKALSPTLCHRCPLLSSMWCRKDCLRYPPLHRSTEHIRHPHRWSHAARYRSSHCGTVYQLTSQGTLNVLHSFRAQNGSCPDGGLPEASLLRATDGTLYGSTFLNGASANRSEDRNDRSYDGQRKVW